MNSAHKFGITNIVHISFLVKRFSTSIQVHFHLIFLTSRHIKNSKRKYSKALYLKYETIKILQSTNTFNEKKPMMSIPSLTLVCIYEDDYAESAAPIRYFHIWIKNLSSLLCDQLGINDQKKHFW